MKHQIKHRYTGDVLFECDLPDDPPSGMAVRLSLKKAIACSANLRGADLSEADMRDTYLNGADLRNANLKGADLRNAQLSNANLNGVKSDFWEILLRAPREITGLRAALVEGRVNGSTYEGACACLIGTIANMRGVCVDSRELGNGMKPNPRRPAERWFLGISTGDTPETSQINAITVEWLDEFVALLEAARTM